QRIPISPQTRQRVLDAVAELGYEIDARGQSLRNGATKTIGVLVPLYENPFFWQVLSGVLSEAEAAGYNLLLSHSTLTPAQEIHSLRELAQQRVDGLIILTSFKLLSPQIFKQLHRWGRPVVEVTSTESDFDYVRQDYSDGTQALMNHL